MYINYDYIRKRASWLYEDNMDSTSYTKEIEGIIIINSMQWITRKDIHDRSDLPKDQQFLALWRGAICLIEYDYDVDLFRICNQPAYYDVYTLPLEREPKITHICLLKIPEDY